MGGQGVQQVMGNFQILKGRLLGRLLQKRFDFHNGFIHGVPHLSFIPMIAWFVALRGVIDTLVTFERRAE